MLCTSDGRVLAGRVIVADSMFARLRGLLGYRLMPEDTALVLQPCDQVHMFFMRFAIGVIFLDDAGKVVFKQRLRPWQVSKKISKAGSVVETAPEILEQVGIGEILNII